MTNSTTSTAATILSVIDTTLTVAEFTVDLGITAMKVLQALTWVIIAFTVASVALLIEAAQATYKAGQLARVGYTAAYEWYQADDTIAPVVTLMAQVAYEAVVFAAQCSVTATRWAFATLISAGAEENVIYCEVIAA